MLVCAVAGVDDVGVEEAREEMRRAGGAVADDDDVGAEGLEVARGVLEGLAFFNEELSVLKLMTSAVRRTAASSKLMRVRVDGSMKRLMTVLPRRAGTFLMARSPTCLKVRAVSSTCMISAALRDSMSRRCLRVQVMA